MQYGHFDDESREYVITRWDTPLPWINYLGCEEFFGLISHTGGGYTFYKDARLRRLTRYRYNNVPADTGGRMLYLRDDETGDFWSPAWQPARRPVEDFTCRHGLGYTTISSGSRGIHAQVRHFVPLGEDLEVWELTLANRREERAILSVFSCVEFCLWDAYDDTTNFQRNYNIGQVEIEGSVIYHKTEYRERRDHFAYFACSEPLAGFDTQREDFLGSYRGWDNPLVVERGTAGNSVAYGWAPVGSHHVRLELEPGGVCKVIFLLGYVENPVDEKFNPPGSQTVNKQRAAPVIARYLDPEVVQESFETLGRYWERLAGVYQVQTPDEHTDRMVNIWNAYQCMVTFNLSRSASYYESGIGRGLGFRDSSQDLLGFVHMVPERARQRILDLAATQLESGGAYHQYQPLTKRGNDAVGGNFNDDPLWLVLAVAAYLKESGDWSLMEERVPYDNRPGTEMPLFEHLQRSLRYTLERLGPHGLPLIGRADWNDCLNLNTFSEKPGESFQTTTNKDGRVAESVFIGGMFVLAAREMAEMVEMAGDSLPTLGKVEVAGGVQALTTQLAAGYRDAAAQMERTVLQHGWDGEWFLRAYDDFGDKVGSRECEEGQIYIEPQGMCVMAGIGLESGQARRALDSVGQRLATEHGILLHQPAYSRYYLHLGEISSYPPGYKENASVFCHTNPWIVIAETILDHGDLAFDYYRRTNPSARQTISEVHRCEPYVYAQTIAGRDAPTFGEAKNSWLSGTATWNYVAITQWILGIRPAYGGLKVAPVLPAGWKGFQAVRIFRGVAYHISVERWGPGNRVTLQVDGRPVVGDVIPLPAGQVRQVEVSVTLA